MRQTAGPVLVRAPAQSAATSVAACRPPMCRSCSSAGRACGRFAHARADAERSRGRHQHLAADTLSLHEQVPAGSRHHWCARGEKRRDRRGRCAARRRVPAGTAVVSMQNGLSNAAVGSQAAPGLRWLAGMVPYNVAELAPGQYTAARPARSQRRTTPCCALMPPTSSARACRLQLHPTCARCNGQAAAEPDNR